MNTIKYEINEKGICLLTFNRVEKHNSFSREFLRDLSNALNLLKNDQSVKILIITGAGKDAFSTGADLKELQGLKSIEDARAYAILLEETSELLFQFPTPVIAAINGYALGGGMGYAAATDYRIIAESAKVGFPAIKLGAILPVTCTLYLKEVIGLSHSKDILLTGRVMGAVEAQEMGLVNRVVKDSDLMDEAYHLAEKIIEGSVDAMMYTKKTLNSLLVAEIQSQKLYPADNFAFLSQTKEWQERIGNFGKK